MSMMCSLKQVSPRLLAALEADPSLIPAAIDLGARSVGTEKGSLRIPSHIQAMVDQMPEEAREQFYKSLTVQWERMMDDPRLSHVVEAGQKKVARGNQTLRGAGLSEEDVAGPISIEKAWHGLHYLLCGQPGADGSPLGSAILGGSETGDDLGYGPARVLSPGEVSAAATALDQATEEILKSRYDAESMNGLKIYPGGWEDEENIEWLLDAAQQVKRYYTEAASRGFGMLLYLT